jgi:hypothetical protein
VDVKKILYSPWGYGTVDAKEGAMSLQLGITQWVVVGISIFIFAFFLLRITRNSNQKKEIVKESLFYLLMFIISILLMLPVSFPFWKAMASLVIIDFTWRILALSTFCVAVLAGFIIHHIKYRWLVGMLLISLAIYANRNHLRINQTLDWPLSFYLKLEKTTNTYGEYTPLWVRNELVEKPKPKVEFSEPNAKITINKQTSNTLQFNIDTKESGKAKINTIYYPGWQVKVNSLPVTIDYQSSGFMEFPLGTGLSKVTARFKETPLRMLSNLFSLFSISFISFLLLKYRK